MQFQTLANPALLVYSDVGFKVKTHGVKKMSSPHLHRHMLNDIHDAACQPGCITTSTASRTPHLLRRRSPAQNSSTQSLHKSHLLKPTSTSRQRGPPGEQVNNERTLLLLTHRTSSLPGNRTAALVGRATKRLQQHHPLLWQEGEPLGMLARRSSHHRPTEGIYATFLWRFSEHHKQRQAASQGKQTEPSAKV
ncbi:hypothetical protein AOLI_G00239870 [Acnodon oligacanthus]